MGKNKARLIQSNYTGFSDKELLNELQAARLASDTLKDTDAYKAALDGNGVNILVEELSKRNITTSINLFG